MIIAFIQRVRGPELFEPMDGGHVWAQGVRALSASKHRLLVSGRKLVGETHTERRSFSELVVPVVALEKRMNQDVARLHMQRKPTAYEAVKALGITNILLESRRKG